MIAAISRLTTDYVDSEDRLRLAAEIVDGPALSLWLTQRLALRLLPALVRWLDGQIDAGSTEDGAASRSVTSDAHKEVVHGFAQEAAVAELKPQEPVRAAASAQGLIESIDLTPREQSLQLVFRTG